MRKDQGTGLGYIAMDHEGKVLASTTRLIELVLEAREVEVFSFRWAIIYLLCRFYVPESGF